MDTDASGRHDVVGTFPDMLAAREAVRGLETRGLDGSRIALAGAAADRARHRGDTASSDRALLSEGRTTAGIGVSTGLVVGAVVGFLASGLLFGFPWSSGRSLAMTLGVTIGLAVAGAAVGLAVSGYRRVSQGEAFEATFEQEPGPVQVAVHDPDGDEHDLVVTVFQEHRAARIEQVGSDGRRQQST